MKYLDKLINIDKLKCLKDKKAYPYVIAIFVIILCISLVVIFGKKNNKMETELANGKTDSNVTAEEDTSNENQTSSEQEVEETVEPTIQPTVEPTIEPTPTVASTLEPILEPTKAVVESTKTPAKTNETIVTANPNNGNKLVAIDAGHQGKQNSEKEPNGPGSSTMKAKVASGTTGVKSKVPEYVVTLQVSLKLRDILKNKGYDVLMIRESHDVNISNAERANMANDAGADIFVRIHCNGLDNSSARGTLTMCQTANNPYCAQYYSQSRKLSNKVVNAIASKTGLKNKGVLESDTMSGINWCKVPVTIIEMGFMSNPEEDMLLVDDAFQNEMALGIADGIDAYFAE